MPCDPCGSPGAPPSDTGAPRPTQAPPSETAPRRPTQKPRGRHRHASFDTQSTKLALGFLFPSLWARRPAVRHRSPAADSRAAPRPTQEPTQEPRGQLKGRRLTQPLGGRHRSPVADTAPCGGRRRSPAAAKPWSPAVRHRSPAADSSAAVRHSPSAADTRSPAADTDMPVPTHRL